MKYFKFITFVTILVGYNNFSNAQTVDWANGNEANLYNIGPQLIKSDSKGNVYNIGRYNKTTDFDPGAGVFNLSTSGSVYNGFITKTNKDGVFLWTKRIYCIKDSYVYAIEIDNNDNIYLTGTFNDTIDLDPGTGTNFVKGQNDFYVIKLDTDGNLIWGRTGSGSGTETSYGIAVDASGAVYTAGFFAGSCDFNPGSGVANISSSSDDIFILKLDKNGNFLWVKRIGSQNAEVAYSISTDRLSNLYITGGFLGTVDFNPNSGVANLSGSGGTDVFICKLDSGGNYRWAKSIGGTNNEFGYRIVADDSGNVFTCGDFIETIDFDPGSGVDNHTSINGNNDLYVLKLDSTGKYKWVYIAGGKGGEYATSVALDKTGNIYLSGNFTDTTDFDAGVGTAIKAPTGGPLGDAYAMKIKSNGKFEWVRTFGSTSFDAARSIHVDNLRNVYLVGLYKGPINFGLSKTYTTANQGYFWLKISQCSISKITNASACRQYRQGNNVYTQSGSYYTSAPGPGGCDTIFTLNLTINKTNPLISQSGKTISANISGATYVWLNCSSGKQVINGQTSKDFTPAASGSYAVAVKLNNCTDTSSCFNFVLSNSPLINFENIKIYPNPGNGLIKISGLPDNASVRISDFMGRILNNNLEFQDNTLDLGSFTNGIYYLTFMFDSRSYSVKYSKE